MRSTRMKYFKSGFLLIVLVVSIVSCKQSRNYRDLQEAFKHTEIADSIPDIDSLLASLPDYTTFTAPLQHASGFEGDVLWPLSENSSDMSVKSAAFLSGVYMADLGYARYFERVQVCMHYLEALRLAGERLAIPTDMFNAGIVAGEEALLNNDMLFGLVDSLMIGTAEYLSESEMYGIACIMSAGLWLETLRIVASNTTQIEIYDDVVNKHFELLQALLSFCNGFSNDTFISELATHLQELPAQQTPDYYRSAIAGIYQKMGIVTSTIG